MLLLKQQFLPGASVKRQQANVSYHSFKHSWIHKKPLSSPYRMCLGVVHPVTEPPLQRQVEPQQTHKSNRLRKLTSPQMRVFAGCWYYPHCITSFCWFFFYERVNTLKPREETDSSASTGNSVCGAKGKLGRFNSFFLIRTDRVMNEHPPKVLRSKRCKVIFTS